MQFETPPLASARATVLAYHERTKHRLDRYARGPETLDWDAQPAPFRTYHGTAQTPLPLLEELHASHPAAQALQQPFVLGQLGQAQDWDLETLGVLLQTALGISAWKTYGPNRWAVRANPSSGNLHPIEAYVITTGLMGLEDGVYHYDPKQHVLELRARCTQRGGARSLHLALSSVMWREAWKYGERAFRYCQLDAGHAMAALAISATLLGVQLAARTDLSAAELASLLGVDRVQDHAEVRGAFTEREEPELLLQLLLQPTTTALPASDNLEFFGRASVIDALPLHHWPVIDEVANVTRAGACPDSRPVPLQLPLAAAPSPHSAQQVLLGRRSAQRFDIQHVMPSDVLISMLRVLMPAPGGEPGIDLILFIHRVQGVAPGLYVLPRRGEHSRPLLDALAKQYSVEPVPEVGAGLPLMRLCESEPKQLARVARALHCHQDIAATSCFALGMLAELEPNIGGAPHRYRDLFREAGFLGQLLYVQSEAAGLRGTGIGCYFDDAVHELLGVLATPYRSLYHFTVGRALDDARVETGPAYPERVKG